MDGSSDRPWDTITKGAAHLAVANDPGMGGVQGGHTVLVRAGTYGEAVYLTGDHAGIAGATNFFLAVGNLGDVRVNGVNLCFDFDSTRHMELNGFHMYGAGAPGHVRMRNSTTDILVENCAFHPAGNQQVTFTSSSGTRCVVRRCLFVEPYRDGIDHAGAGSHVIIEECLIFLSRGTGILLRPSNGGMTLRNSILVANRSHGIEIASTTAVLNMSNVLVYANGPGNVFFQNRFYDTETELDELAQHANMNFTNIVVANPGFAGRQGHSTVNWWKIDSFYENSPVLKENSGFDRDMGVRQNPDTTPVSSNTYYVSVSGGDDSRSPAQAMNESTPWLTISKAAAHAVAGDTVVVKPGVYSEYVVITNGGSGDLRVVYQAEGEVTVVPGSRAFDLDCVAGVVIDGFRIDGVAGSGGSIRSSHAFDNIIKNCIISNYGSRPGIYTYRNYGMYILDTVIHSGEIGVSYSEGGSQVVVERCTIYSNTVAGISGQQTGGRIYNSAIFNNQVNVSVAVAAWRGSSSSPVMENCVIANAGNDGVYCNRDNFHVKNTVFCSNTFAVRESNETASKVNVAYCCFFGNGVNFREKDTTNWDLAGDLNAIANCSNNIVADPAFRNMYFGDFRLLEGSSCIDTGTLTTGLETDMYGNPRLVGSAVDIGVYEMPHMGTLMRLF